MKYEKGDVVGIRYRTSGTFGGYEFDWRAGIYRGYDGERHVVITFPQLKGRSDYPERVNENDIRSAGELWPWLKDCCIADKGGQQWQNTKKAR